MSEVFSWLFSPHVFEVGALFAFAIGVSMALAPSKGDIRAAHLFFTIGFILTLGRVDQLVIELQGYPVSKYLIAFVLFGCVGMIWLRVHNWVKDKQSPVSIVSSGVPASVEPAAANPSPKERHDEAPSHDGDHKQTPSGRKQQVLPAVDVRSQSEDKSPPHQIISAPNGIAIGGGVVNNPTVTNNFGPPPLPAPVVTVCVTGQPTSAGYQTYLLLTSNIPLKNPRYVFSFDKSITDANVGSPDIGVMSHGTLPMSSDKAYGFVFNGEWGAGERLQVVVNSKEPLKLLDQASTHGESFVFKNGSCQ